MSLALHYGFRAILLFLFIVTLSSCDGVNAKHVKQSEKALEIVRALEAIEGISEIGFVPENEVPTIVVTMDAKADKRYIVGQIRNVGADMKINLIGVFLGRENGVSRYVLIDCQNQF